MKARLVGAIALVLVLVLIAGGALTYNHAQRKVEVEMDAAMEVARNTVARRLENLGDSYRPIAYLEETIEIFDGDRHVAAALVDGTGAEMKRSVIPPPANEVPDWFLKLVAPTYPVEQVPLPVLGNHLGSIALYPDPRSEVDEVWADVRLNLTVLGGFSVAAFAFVTLVIGRALAPITGLSEAMRRIGQGDYAVAVPVGGSPELALLCRGCNDMARRLADMSARNRQLGEQLVRLQDEERAELARELHDEVGPLLFAVDVDVAEIARVVETTGGGPRGSVVAAKAAAARQAASAARTYVRDILGRLRPGLIGSLGLAAAIRELAAFHQSREPETAFDLDLSDVGFGPEVDAVVLAVVREAVVNAVKHARPRRIEIAVVDLGGEVAVRVVDDGAGLAPRAGPPVGYGLVGMRERVEAIGGSIAIGPRPTGRGTAVSAVIPVAGIPVPSAAPRAAEAEGVSP
nr:ATP-binding protein [Oharaeibacter diazotrophicus]